MAARKSSSATRAASANANGAPSARATSRAATRSGMRGLGASASGGSPAGAIGGWNAAGPRTRPLGVVPARFVSGSFAQSPSGPAQTRSEGMGGRAAPLFNGVANAVGPGGGRSRPVGTPGVKSASARGRAGRGR